MMVNFMRNVFFFWVFLLIMPYLSFSGLSFSDLNMSNLTISGLAFAASPMIEKHIFLPEKVSDKKKVPFDEAKIKKDIIFTGVVISSKGRYAFIKQRSNKDSKKIYEQGEELAGGVLSEVASNYIVLSNEGNDLKLKLYSGTKKRPAPVKEKKAPPEKVVQTTKKTPAKTAANTAVNTGQSAANNAASTNQTSQGLFGLPAVQNQGGTAGQTATGATNPFKEALEKAMQNKSKKPASNPFTEAIKRAQNK
jgi:hypothetical protein